MSGSDRFLLSYLRVFLRLACGWIQNIWSSQCVSRIRQWPIVGQSRNASQSPLDSQNLNGSPAPGCDDESEKTVRTLADIPSPKGWPLIGTTLDLIAAGSAPNLHKYIDKRHQQFGHIFRERLGSQEAVFVSSANLMRSVFLYEGQYPTHPLPDSWLLFNKLHDCQRGLFFMNGPEWHANRKILNRFLINGNLDWMNVHVEYCTRKLIENWKAKVENMNDYLIVENLEGQLYRWSIDVISAIMFGYGTESCSEKLTKTLDKFSKNVHKIFDNSAKLMNFPVKLARALNMKIWKQFEKDVSDVLEMGYNIIDMHTKEAGDYSEDDGLFSKMLMAGMSLDVIKRIFVDLIIAAGDTTTFSSQWALYLLSQKDDLQAKIRAESGDYCDKEILDGLIKETLRLYPVAPFIGRFIASDAVIGGYELKKDTLLLLSLYTSGRDPSHFPNPLIADPERWSRNDSGQFKGVLQAHGTLPFAIGSRSCIGRKIAINQMRSLLTMVNQTFQMKCFNEEEIDIVLRLVAVPNHPLRLGIKLVEE